MAVPIDLKKLSNVVDKKFVKINEFKIEISSITNLACNALINAKINEVKNEIPSLTDLATTTVFIAVENKIPNVSDLIKKAGYDAEIKDIENEYFTPSDYNKFTNNILDAKITRKKFAFYWSKLLAQ